MSQSAQPGTGSLAPAGLTEASVQALAAAYAESGYLRDLRQAAWSAYQRIPMPTNRDEEWRRTDIRPLEIDALQTPARLDGRGEESAALRATLASDDALAGLLVQRNGAESSRSLDPDLAAKGVVFGTIDAIARERPDLIAEYLAKEVPADDEKFVALSTAFRTGGSFLYVPKNVTVDLPIRSVIWGDLPGLALCPRTVIVAETGADVTYIDDYASDGLASPKTRQGFSASVVEIVARPGARVRYASLQEWDPSVWSFSTLRAMADDDATVNTLVVALGGQLSRSRVQTHLRGRGASAEMLGVLFGTGRQHFDHHTTQEHIAPNTTSDLLYKAVLKDASRSVFSGMIRAHKNAQKTDAVQTNRNLLLSSKSRADSIPNLEILANDLRCTHAAAVAPVDEEQLFYLQARGLTQPDAVRLIVEGFFEPLLERIPLPGIRERLRASVEARIG